MRREENEGPSVPITVGKISNPAGQNKITKIEVYDGVTQTIFDGSSKFTAEMPSGRAWKLRVEADLYGLSNGWAACVTVVASGVPSSYRKQSLTYRFEFGGGTSKAFIFDMGDMPDAPVTITRVKLWYSDLYTTGAPPESDW